MRDICLPGTVSAAHLSVKWTVYPPSLWRREPQHNRTEVLERTLHPCTRHPHLVLHSCIWYALLSKRTSDHPGLFRYRSWCINLLYDVLDIHLRHVFTVRVCDLLLFIDRSCWGLRLLFFLLPNDFVSYKVTYVSLEEKMMEVTFVNKETHLLLFLLFAVFAVRAWRYLVTRRTNRNTLKNNLLNGFSLTYKDSILILVSACFKVSFITTGTKYGG